MLPPLVAVAVKVTGIPPHMLFTDSAIVTVGAEAVLTVIVTGVAVAVGTDVQVADEVSITET